MAMPTESCQESSTPLEQVLARVLRHEVGDLLQTIYAATAILQERLPSDGMERQILLDLKTRAETCRLEIDAVVDLVCQPTLNPTTIELGAFTNALVEPLRARFPRRVLTVNQERVDVHVDGQRFAQMLSLLLRAACSHANQQVQVTVKKDSRGAIWELWRDGPPVPEETLGWLVRPFTTTRHALAGLGLALAQRVVTWHGGQVEIVNSPESGFLVRLLLGACLETE